MLILFLSSGWFLKRSNISHHAFQTVAVFLSRILRFCEQTTTDLFLTIACDRMTLQTQLQYGGPCRICWPIVLESHRKCLCVGKPGRKGFEGSAL